MRTEGALKRLGTYMGSIDRVDLIAVQRTATTLCVRVIHDVSRGLGLVGVLITHRKSRFPSSSGTSASMAYVQIVDSLAMVLVCATRAY